MKLIQTPFLLLIFLVNICNCFAMEYADKLPKGFMYAVKQSNSFEQALMQADLGWGCAQLKKYVQEAADLNILTSLNQSPLQVIVESRHDSDIVTLSLLRGARTDFVDSKNNTLFHYIARHLRLAEGFYPRQNLLSALALPTYCSLNEKAVQEELSDEQAIKEKALRSTQSNIRTFLLCLNQPELNSLKPVKLCILAHLIDSSCSQKLFSLTLPQMRSMQQLVQFHFRWFSQLVHNNSGDDREKFLATYAPIFARYRLTQAAKVLELEDNDKRTPLAVAQTVLEFVRSNKKLGDTIANASRMVDDLATEGFVEHHMPDCTKIIANLLAGKEPFDGFSEFNKDTEG